MAETKQYVTLRHEASAEFEEKRSVFIGYAKPVKTEAEAMDFVKKIRGKHGDARHNVFAYTLGGGVTARYSDDGEPQGTAGIPVLDVLRKSGVDDACIVVTRYFGGILLGAGGLVRAYSAAAKMALDAAEIATFEPYTELSFTCSYPEYQKISAELPRFGTIVDDTQFADNVTVTFAVKKEKTDEVITRIREMTAGRSVPTVVGERFDCE